MHVLCCNHYFNFIFTSLQFVSQLLNWTWINAHWMLLRLFVAVLSGSGGGMMLMSSLVLLQQYFNRRRPLAVGIAGVGFSVGGLASGPLTAVLLEVYAIHGTLLIIAGLYFQLSVFCCLFRPAPIYGHRIPSGKTIPANSADGTEEIMLTVSPVKSDISSDLQQNSEPTVRQSFLDTQNDRRPRSCAARLLRWLSQLFADLFDLSLLHCIRFPLFLVASFCCFFGLSSFLQHIPSRGAYLGVEPGLIRFLPTLISCATGISRIVFSFIANMQCTQLFLLFGISVTLSGMVQITACLTTSFVTLALYCILQGTVNGQ